MKIPEIHFSKKILIFHKNKIIFKETRYFTEIAKTPENENYFHLPISSVSFSEKALKKLRISYRKMKRKHHVCLKSLWTKFFWKISFIKKILFFFDTIYNSSERHEENVIFTQKNFSAVDWNIRFQPSRKLRPP